MGDFASVLKQLRKQRGFTQLDLAKALGIAKSTISMYEVGAREPDFETLELIAEYFNVDMNCLLGKAKSEDITFDDFTYAMHNEGRELTPQNKQKLLELARMFRLAQQNDEED